MKISQAVVGVSILVLCVGIPLWSHFDKRPVATSTEGHVDKPIRRQSIMESEDVAKAAEKYHAPIDWTERPEWKDRSCFYTYEIQDAIAALKNKPVLIHGDVWDIQRAPDHSYLLSISTLSDSLFSDLNNGEYCLRCSPEIFSQQRWEHEIWWPRIVLVARLDHVRRAIIWNPATHSEMPESDTPMYERESSFVIDGDVVEIVKIEPR